MALSVENRDNMTDIKMRNSRISPSKGRSHEMESALYFAKFKGGVSLAVANLSSDFMNENNLQNTLDEADHQASEMRAQLLEKSRVEAALVQETLGTRVNEDVLKERLDEEDRSKVALAADIKELEGQMASIKLQCHDKMRKAMSGQKSVTVLEIQIKDLQTSLELTGSKERKTSQRSVEANRECRELERELMDLRIENTRMTDGLEKKVEQQHELTKQQELKKDACLRELQQAQIQNISLEQDIDEKQLEHDHAKDDYDVKKRILDELTDQCQMQQVLAEKDRLELEKRLEDEEASNNAMVEELAEKAKKEQLLLLEAKQAVESRDMLAAQLEDKMKLTLELGKRLHALQMHFQQAEFKLEDKTEQSEMLTKTVESIKSDFLVLQSRLAKEQSNTRDINKWTRREVSACEDLEAKLMTLKTKDTDHRLRVKQADADKAVLKEQVEIKKNCAEKARAEMHEAHAAVDALKDKLGETEDSLTEMTGRYEKKSAKAEVLSRELKELTREFMDKDHQRKLQINKLESTLDEQNDEHQRFAAQADKSNKQLEDLHSLLQETADKSEEQKAKLLSLLREMEGANEQLVEEMTQQTKRNDLMEADLLNSEHRIKNVLGQMTKNESTAAKLAQINAEETILLQTQLDRETTSLEKLQTQLSQLQSQLRMVEGQFEEAVRQKRQMQKLFREEKFDAERMTQALEDKKEPELENESRIKELETDRDLDAKHLTEKQEAVETLQSETGEAKSNLKMLKKELRDAEAKESDYFSHQQIDRRNIEDLEAELKAQEAQHLADARSVRSKITQLQEALQEKVNTVDHLTKATQAMKAKAKQLGVRLEQTEAEAAQAQTSFEAMLDQEQTQATDLRAMLEAKTRDIMTVRAQNLNKDERIQQLAASLSERNAQREALNHETYMRARQAHQAQLQVETLTVRERDLLDTTNDFEEQIVELKLQLREGDHVQSDLNKQVQNLKNENAIMRKQIEEKMKAERILLTELEAKRLHLDTAHANSVGETRAHATAEREMEGLIHALNDAK